MENGECRMKKALFCLALAGALLSFAEESPITVYPTRGHLSRAFARMERSTGEKPETLRVLFYGQSIVGQKVWCDNVVAAWKARYPTVNFVVKNLAIGGYATDTLVHCIESDIFPFYPDVVFFHDYGDVLGGYGYMLGEVRRRTTAEIVIWSSHLRYDEDPATIMAVRAGKDVPRKGNERSIDATERRTGEMRALAEDLDLVFVDLQGEWCRILLENKWKPTALIVDSVHLNQKGFQFYSRILIDALTPGPGGADEGGASGTVSHLAYAQAAKTGENGDITVRFDGNRIAAVANGAGVVEPTFGAFAAGGEVLIDGTPVREIPSQWYHTRSTPIERWFPGCDTPVKGKTALQNEEWTLSILTYATNAKPKYVTYRLEGSKTGFDGEGCSTNTFVSNSGRVVIPGVWLGCTVNPFGSDGPVAGVSKTAWKSMLVPVPVYGPRPKWTETVLAQGLANGPHVLTIRNPHGDLGIAGFVVSKPNPKWERPLTERMQKFLKRANGAEFFYGDAAWH